MKSDYEERRERRIAGNKCRTAKTETEAQAIPFGLPILVSHHSEGRDHRY